MKEDTQKILGERRRELLLTWLRESTEPITGSALAKKTNVSRQVIVQDVSLLKARNEPIIATSQGYVYFRKEDSMNRVTRVIAVHHAFKDTANELYILVDHGATVKDVSVEHPIYGDLTALLMHRSRRDVDIFLKSLKDTGASLLSKLTDGTHLHTIEAETEWQLDEACAALKKAGYLLEQQ
jgi:transcriptional regulator of NAD metabolism